MNTRHQLSHVTKEYLSTFHCILETMIQNMTDVELTASISQNFIIQMIPHHQAAIEMSQNLLKYTTNVPLQTIALDIITEQTKSIETMCQALRPCSMLCNTEQDLCLYQKRVDQILHTMFSGMENAPFDNSVSADFIREMIPHHQGAVEMSKNALRFDICPELVPILEAIITSQERGIRQMRQILHCGGCLC